MASPMWFAGVCDTMLQRAQWWLQAWPRGDEFATRSGWSVTGGEFQIVTARVVKVAISKPELEHMIRILDNVKPNWTFTAFLKNKLEKFESFRLLPRNLRIVPMETGDEQLKVAVELLQAAKTGQASLSSDVDAALNRKDGTLWG